jgi:glycosyltransferase involved in cell wall biosynthesis
MTTGPATARPVTAGAGAAVHVVLPGSVADPASPSGGSTYDLRVCAALAAAGRPVRRHDVPGAWPHPRPGDLDRLAAALDAVPAGGVVLLDGLVACAAPDVVEPAARRLRLVVLVHLPLADETGQDPADAAAPHAAETRTLRAASVVVATGTAVGRRLAADPALAGVRVRVVPPGVDPAPVTAPSDAGSRLVCVASVTPRKGHDVLVEALAGLTDLAWTLVCAGPEPAGSSFGDLVRRRVVDAGLGDRVRLAGPLPADRVAALYAAADLLVLPSRAEPYGMVVTEALARGVPVVASDVDGVPEALGLAAGGTAPGLLVPPGDVAALRAALREWLTDPLRRNALRASAVDRRSALAGWGTTAAELAAVLDEAGAG